jgi:hypothetical protein
MGKRHLFRRYRGYDGCGLTSHHIGDVLPYVLNSIGKTFAERGDLIISLWPDIIGPKLASMTQAVSFHEGILEVKVQNSTLYSLLRCRDKYTILKKLRDKLPTADIHDIVFRMR